MLQNLTSAAVLIGAFRVNKDTQFSTVVSRRLIFLPTHSAHFFFLIYTLVTCGIHYIHKGIGPYAHITLTH